MNRTNKQNQQGAVAIFIVIFAALFITIITVSFVGIMLKNQTQSLNADLADSAYDSALAGVEDAKRLFQKYKECEAAGILDTDPDCVDAKNAIAAGCFGVKRFITQSKTASGETTIQRSADSSNDTSLDQAYTCVKLNLNIPYREGSIDSGKFDVIPLGLKDTGGSMFNKIKISWYTTSTGGDNTGTISYPTFPQLRNDSGAGRWPDNAPPLLRVQFVNLSGGSINLSDFDYNTPGTRRVGTTFLYPRSTGISTASILPSPAPITPIKCVNTSVGNATYHCNAILTLPAQPVSPNSYLILSPIYGNTHYSIQVLDASDNPYIFTNVANVDSTGRANDLFRRVKVQVELDPSGGGGNPVYPAAAVETRQLCKDFSITDKPAEFDPGSCAP